MYPSEIIFEVTEAVEGGYDAEALGYSIFTQGEDWDDLEDMVKDAVRCHFDDSSVPRALKLRPLGRSYPEMTGNAKMDSVWQLLTGE